MCVQGISCVRSLRPHLPYPLHLIKVLGQMVEAEWAVTYWQGRPFFLLLPRVRSPDSM